MVQRVEGAEKNAATIAGSDGSFDALRNELWGRFLIWEARRRGLYSAVFAAHDALSGDRVLLHVMSRAALSRTGLATTYRNAVEQAAALRVGGVLPVLAHGASDNFHWYSTPLMPKGTQLSVLLAEGGAMDPDVVIGVVSALGDLLRDCHSRGAFHGHLSAACVYLEDSGLPVVGEFGTRHAASLVARNESRAKRAAKTGSGATGSAASRDFDALLLLACECLTGRAVTERTGDTAGAWRQLEQGVATLDPDTLSSITRAIYGDDPVSPSTIPELEERLRRDLGPEPDEEVQVARTYEEVENTRVVLDEPAFILFEEPTPPAAAPPQRRRWPLLASVVMTVCVTWLALEQVPRLGRMAAARTTQIDSSRGTLATSFTAPAPARNDTALTSPVEDKATAAPPTEPPAVEIKVPLPTPDTRPAKSAKAGKTPSRGGTSATAPVSRAGNRSATPPAALAASPDSAALAAAARQPGRLFISTRPWGFLYLDGNLIGNTPAANLEIAPGVHNLRVLQDGYQPYERRITVTPGASVRLIDIVLVKQAP